MFDESTVFQLTPDVLSVEADGETVVLSYAEGKYFGLRGAVRQVLDLLRQGATFGELVARMTAKFNISAEQARDDLSQILEKMLGAGVVQSR
jgi:hypothetical protein